MSFRIRKKTTPSSESGCRATGSAGFTLLEVMIAVAVLAIALVTLIGAQSRSVDLSADAAFDLAAALLAQEKLAELAVWDYERLDDGEGDFGRDRPDFVWKAEVVSLAAEELGLKGAGEWVKRVDLTISARNDPRLTYTIRTLISKKPVKKERESAAEDQEASSNGKENPQDSAQPRPRGRRP